MSIQTMLALFTTVLASSTTSAADIASCRVEPFSGATTARGAVAQMTVSNSGLPCSITNYGVPASRTNPSESGSITSQPVHGNASFAAPQAIYVPEAGFIGEDEFAYEALAKGNSDERLRLRVRVKVKVVAP